VRQPRFLLAAVLATVLLSACAEFPLEDLAPLAEGDPAEPADGMVAPPVPEETPVPEQPAPPPEEPAPAPGAASADLGEVQSLADVPFEGPLVISQGGTYTGNWESRDPEVPAVQVATTEPVVIEDANLRGTGHLLEAGVDGVDVTVRDSRGESLVADQAGVQKGRFARIMQPRRLVIEHNELLGTAGIIVSGYTGEETGETIKVVANRARNIDGRVSDGNGGLVDQSVEGDDFVQFVQLHEVQGVPGVEIAANEVVNEPGESRVEDNISLYLSSGTPDNPIRVADNYIEGAYPLNPEGDGDDYSGGGIMLGDGSSGDPATDPAHAVAEGNHVVNTSNYGIAIASGHNLVIRENRVLADNVLPDGGRYDGEGAGIYVWNYHGTSEFGSNHAIDNVVAWQNGDGSRTDTWLPDVSEDSGNQSADLDRAAVDAEHELWLGRMAARNRLPGVR
jgi:hypothetical protein